MNIRPGTLLAFERPYHFRAWPHVNPNFNGRTVYGVDSYSIDFKGTALVISKFTVEEPHSQFKGENVTLVQIWANVGIWLISEVELIYNHHHNNIRIGRTFRVIA